MPNILKRFHRPETNLYVFQPASELVVEEEPPPPPPEAEETEAEASVSPEEDPLGFAKLQAEALLRDARREAEEEAEAYRASAREEVEAELEELRAEAREDGYRDGFQSGMDEALRKAKLDQEELAKEQIREVQTFLTAAARARDQILDDSREDLKDLALTIAEKVIQVSLKNSGDVILRMVDAATDTHKRCEWAHIYVADCDVRGKALTVPELTAALGHISERVRVIPMADDESGTCIVELPDVILDASVSTQLATIREVLDSSGLE